MIDIDLNAKRAALSIKELLPEEVAPEPVKKAQKKEVEKTEHSEELDVSLGDVLNFDIKE